MDILTKLVDYQQPTCLCVMMENHFAFMWIVFTFVDVAGKFYLLQLAAVLQAKPGPVITVQ